MIFSYAFPWPLWYSSVYKVTLFSTPFDEHTYPAYRTFAVPCKNKIEHNILHNITLTYFSRLFVFRTILYISDLVVISDLVKVLLLVFVIVVWGMVIFTIEEIFIVF